ncbi:molecular chaperone [Serratia marcescens]|nr:molecular chaperone [Serratia marcescens]MBH2766658.1 molecular chaperone [Serratia marcescens]MBH2766718.1 molecular chaperone [Serratia marcescens]
MRRLILLTFVLLGAVSTAGGASLQVTPTAVAFSPHESARQIWLSNTGQHPIQGQVRLYGWTQVDGNDVLTPTSEMGVAPPILEIPGGGTQLVRVVNRVPEGQRVAGERAYRLIVDELPPARANQTAGVQFLLRYSLPVFVAPLRTKAATALAPLQVSVRNEKHGAVLRIDNPRLLHVKLTRLVLVAADGGTTVLQDGLLGYVLAGQSRSWHLARPVVPGRLMVNLDDARTPETLLVYR